MYLEQPSSTSCYYKERAIMEMNRTKAAELVTILNQDDPEWRYEIQTTGTGSKVVVYDETNRFLGELAVIGNIGNRLAERGTK